MGLLSTLCGYGPLISKVIPCLRDEEADSCICQHCYKVDLHRMRPCDCKLRDDDPYPTHSRPPKASTPTELGEFRSAKALSAGGFVYLSNDPYVAWHKALAKRLGR